ncbi:hypothetical protein [Haloferax larsenii]|uniref:Uncharacterized protein n=1 Tax=Haloferax larsenii TaxID=302484 RepID=A0A1H7KI11_HALLR|nr:hypothetical protein [Haloferax larsenii]SEK86412.1 hypothetical protein SAMN04488691_10211 [Haloferax larsenii]
MTIGQIDTERRKDTIDYIKSYWALIAGVVIALLVFVDYLLGGSIFVSWFLTSGPKGQSRIPVLVSVLLFYAYILQYQTSVNQHRLMESQQEILEADYIPILEEISFTAQDKRNGIPGGYIVTKIKNIGNSLAKDIEIFCAIEIITHNHKILNKESRLSSRTIALTQHESSRRSSGIEGSVIAPDKEEELSCPVEYNCSGEPVGFATAMDRLADDDAVDKVRFGFQVRFKNSINKQGAYWTSSKEITPQKGMGFKQALNSGRDIEHEYFD